MRYSICVSGAATGETVNLSCDLAYQLGSEIAKAGHIITTGATVGLPMYAAKGAFEGGGTSIGFSPAASLREHIYKYRLPIGFFDFVNFTGMHYIGRDIHLVQSSDAIITVGGRFGSLHEFTTAVEAHMPCGVLLGSGGLADFIPELMKQIDAPRGTVVVYDTNPEKLVRKIIKMLDEENKDINTRIVEREWYAKASVCDPEARRKQTDYRAG
jgi:uncharacterized protein (TIGR00725 family)